MVQRKTQRLIQKIKSNKKTIIIFLYTVGSMLFLFSIYFDTLTGNPFDIGTKQIPFFATGVLFIVMGFLIEKYPQITETSKFLLAIKETPKLTKVYNFRSLFFLSIVLFLSFLIIFLLSSTKLSSTGLFSKYSIIFEMDIPRVMMDMTSALSAHDRTHVHPLYVLMVNPFGSFLIALFKQRVISAVILSSILGAWGVQLALLVTWLLTKDLWKSTILAAIFGFSSSQFFLTIIPDTASLAVCSIAITFILFIVSIRKKHINGVAWLLAGLFTLGVTITNFAQTMICYSILVLSFGINRNNIFKIVRYFFSVLFVAILLSLIQKQIYPSSILFFLPNAYQEEQNYLSTLLFSQPWRVLLQVFRSFLLDNFVAPIPVTFYGMNNSLPYLTFTRASTYLPFGVVALILWISFLLPTWFHVSKSSENRLLLIGVCLSLLFYFFLHLFYGATSLQPNHIELFLYTGNVTILVLMVFAVYLGSSRKTWLLIAVATFLFFLSVNNLLILNRIIGLYQ